MVYCSFIPHKKWTLHFLTFLSKPWHRSYKYVYVYMWANYCNSMIRSFWGGFVYKHHHLGFFLTVTVVAIICWWWSPSIHHPLSGRHLIISSSWASQTPLLRSYIHEPCLKFDYFQASATFLLDVFFRGEKNTNSNSKRISTGASWCGCCDFFLVFQHSKLISSECLISKAAFLFSVMMPLSIYPGHLPGRNHFCKPFPPLKSSSHLWWSARQNLIGAWIGWGAFNVDSNKLPKVVRYSVWKCLKCATLSCRKDSDSDSLVLINVFCILGYCIYCYQNAIVFEHILLRAVKEDGNWLPFFCFKKNNLN